MQSATSPAVEPSLDRFARLVSRALSVPVALVSLVEAERQVFPGAIGLPPAYQDSRETPLTHSFCQYVVADRAPLVVRDARDDERLRDNRAIADLGVVAYAGWPITDHRGTIVGSLCAIDRVPRDWSSDDLEMLADLAAACSTELSERGLRIVEQELGHRSRVLLALSDRLSATSTPAEVARAVEQVALDELGCLHAGMWLHEEDERHPTAPGALTYVVPPDGSWESAIRNARLPVDETNPLGLTLLESAPQHFATRDEQNSRYPHLDTSAQIGNARSFTPLMSREGAVGVMAFLWDGTHTLTDQDRLTIEVLSSYTAVAVQRAMLMQERLDALVTLQGSLLPRLPKPEHLELAARYRPAAARDQVGGDWYDAVIMPSGATSLMVGDVVGHDLEAAAVMGQLRHMLRAIAWAVDDAPSHNVTRLDQAMADLVVDGLASLIYARIEPEGDQWSFRWTNAGHPPPVLVAPDGDATLLDQGVPDLLLGIEPSTPRTDNRTLIAPGSTLLLYTDGLVERRGEVLDEGLARVRKAAESVADRAVDDFLDEVLAELAPERLDDDVAVLAVRFGATTS